MNRLLLRFDRKLKQVMDMGGFWEDMYVEDLNKIIVLDDFRFEDIQYKNDLLINNVVVFFDTRMTQKQIDDALLNHYMSKHD